MAMPNPTDPFLEAQSDILTHLSATRTLHTSCARIRSLAPNSPEHTQARHELQISLQELSNDLQDLIDSVKAVEGDPFRYGLDVAEVARRRELVREIGQEVERMGAEAREKGSSGGGGLPPPSEFEDADEGGGYEAFEQQRQVELMQEQDEALDGVFRTVGNLRAQADDMGRELEEQAGLIGDVEGVAERVGGKLQGGLRRVGKVVRDNEETWSSCCIGVLIMVLILLLVLVLIL